MPARPNWFYDEIKHAGVDYSDPAQVAVYDSRHQKFRDYEKSAEAVINAIGIGPEHTVIDMGAGTGAFASYAAACCKTVYAVDVSAAMLDYARRKAENAGRTNIVFCQAGFLTYEHQAPPADVMVSVAALHHLPDFWKLVGLRRAAQDVETGGQVVSLRRGLPRRNGRLRNPIRGVGELDGSGSRPGIRRRG